MAKYRILSIDGGGDFILSSLYVLRRIEEQRSFLHNVKMVAGTSSGGISALSIAANDNKLEGLEAVIDMMIFGLPGSQFMTNVNVLINTITGCKSLLPEKPKKKDLQKLFGDKTLGDLKQKVVIIAFEMDGILNGRRTWKPKMFNNTRTRDNPDMKTSLVDIGMCTSASAIMYPIYDDCVDGGLFANNPSMCALAEALYHPGNYDNYDNSVDKDDTKIKLEDISLLSVGTGLRPEYIDIKNRNWGWRQWLFNTQHPLTLIDAFARGGVMAIEFQCKHILTKKHFFRLDFPMDFRALNINSPEVKRKFKEAAYQADLGPAMDWMEKNEWFDK